MADILNKAALAYLLEQVLLADADVLVTLTLEQAGVQTALDFMSLEVSPDMPLKYDRPTEGSEKAKKCPVTPCRNVPNQRTQGLHSLSHDKCSQQVL